MQTKKRRLLTLISRRVPFLRDLFFLNWKIGRVIFESLTRRSMLLCHCESNVRVISIDGYKNIFCGYYDVSPFSPADNNILIIHAINLSVYSEQSVSQSVDIVIYKRATSETQLVDSTNTWNWQQGARCQWIDKGTIVYNKLIKGKVTCVVADIANGEKRELPINLSIAYKNEYILSIDYCALSAGSEYGYPGLPYQPESDEIKRYDLLHHQVTRLFSHHELDFLVPAEARKKHINHILPSPDGRSFVFIYRYWLGRTRHDSLVHYSFLTNKLDVIIENQTISHYAWKDSNMLLAWMVIGNMPGYYLVAVKSKQTQIVSGSDDGHPNFVNSSTIITDMMSSSSLAFPQLTLYLQDIGSLRREDLVTLSHPTIFRYGKRCDMHVSLSSDKTLFQIDSRHIPHRRNVIVGNVISTILARAEIS